MQRRENRRRTSIDAWGSETLLPTCYAWNANRKQSSSASKNTKLFALTLNLV
jgi:hypothetical protein